MRTLAIRLLMSAALGVIGAGCAADARKPDPPPAAALDLDQRWNANDRKGWYEASQGSRFIPLSWLQNLQRPQGGGAILDDENVRALGYLPHTTSTNLRLPVGFAVDRTPAARLTKTNLTWMTGQMENAPWVGLNCSACHTAEITYKGATMRVDGGPALSDFQKLVAQVRAAVRQTRSQEALFTPFAAAVVGRPPGEEDIKALRDAMDVWLAREAELERLNDLPAGYEYGYGRVDAFGHIYNKTAYATQAANQKPNRSDAPVSYPFLWNIVQHDRVQWNGQVPNKKIPGLSPFDIGAMGRNVGEVIGVFADIELRAGDLKPYRSSVDTANLDSLEKQLGRLRPPRWPVNVFPPVENQKALVAEGQRLFVSKRCSTCHAPLDRTDLTTAIKADMSLFNGGDRPPPGTDPWMACNAYARTASTGVLQGTKANYFVGKRMGAEAPISDLLQNAVSGVLVDQKGAIAKTAAASIFGIERPPQVTRPVTGELGKTAKDLQLEFCMAEKSDRLGYKARPLTGIWATAPYLHNGSVPTLDDLLKPPGERPTSFYVGSREFDPVKVGYLSTSDAPGNSWVFRTNDTAGKPIPGNSNAGHDYNNAAITPAQRKALIEYLKTL